MKTCELRWFLPGTPPTAINNWFEYNCPGEVVTWENTRDDWYLLPQSPCDYLNLKLRQGRLEIKWRNAEHGIFNCQNLGQGKAESWLKWICADQQTNSFLPTVKNTPGSWLKVNKIRSQRELELETTCHIELTQLKVKNQSWWTIAIESMGNINTLKTFVEQVSQTCPKLELHPNQSSAYPHWLTHSI